MEDTVHILIVEDSHTQAIELQYLLEKNHYQVTVAGDGRQALALLQQIEPTIIISDIVMPEMNGYELCKAIKDNSRLKDIPVILLTSLSDPEDVINGLSCGANNFIVKPYDESFLLSRIRYILANTEIRKTASSQMGIKIIFREKEYFLTSERIQMIDLLLSTYEVAIQKNLDFEAANVKLQQARDELERRVAERTAELSAANVQLKLEIEERKRAEEEREKLQNQFIQAQKMESVGRLAGGVAHDFNNMLGIIIGYAEMALDQVSPAEPLHANLEEIYKAANRSADLTRQLLAFARKQTVAPRVLDLNETLEGMLNMLRRLIGEDIDLAWLPGKNLWPIKLDPSQIDQILANLCVNARDAITNSGKLTIETGTISLDESYCADHLGFVPGDYAILAVSDNGCGMDKEILQDIFEPFFTTKDAGKGSGLGLATVYGIVKQNSGFINVYSEPGQGTTIKIYLPRHMETDAPEEKTVSAGGIVTGHETILLVEDEAAILKMTSMMLEQLGYTVFTASAPGQAIRISESVSNGIDLLMTDVVMPEMSGRDLAEKLLQLYPNLKCLYMSGYTANVITHQGVLDKGVHFIHKPFTKQDLATKLREVLGDEKNTTQ